MVYATPEGVHDFLTIIIDTPNTEETDRQNASQFLAEVEGLAKTLADKSAKKAAKDRAQRRLDEIWELALQLPHCHGNSSGQHLRSSGHR